MGRRKKRKDVGLIVLSAVDLVTGLLSLIFSAFAIQVLAIMASGLTLMKAVKVAIQTEKTAIFVKPIAVTAIRQLTRSERMKSFFEKIKVNLKNNPVTLVTAIVELAACGGLGYVLTDYLDRFHWAVGWKIYAVSFGMAALIYAAICVLTVYLGHDNPAFAKIREAVKFIGGEKAVTVLDASVEETKATISALKEAEAKAKAEEERIAAERAKDEAIYAKIIEEENKRKEAEKKAKIAAYKATHPEER